MWGRRTRRDRAVNRSASPETHPRSGADVCPLPTRIVLSYLTFRYTDQAWKLSFQEVPARLAPADFSQRGRCCHLLQRAI